MHVVQVITELLPAGAERVVLNLSRGLIGAGHRVSVVSLKPLPPVSFVVDGLREAGAAIETLGVTRDRPWRGLGLGSLLRRLAPDLVHAHLIHAHLAARWASRGAPWPLVNTVHIAERRDAKHWHFTADRLTLRWCTVQTAVSEAVRDYHAARLGQPPESMPVIYNGIEPPTPLTPAEIEMWRRQWGLDGCDRVIGSVGRLDWQKGYDLLLGLAKPLADRLPAGQTWGLAIVGEGARRGELEALAAGAPANLIVRLPGFDPHAAQAAGAFDLFVMPSRYEGFGLTLAEAMGHGIPLLANRVDSLPELLRDYPNGETIDFAGSPEAAAERMVELAQRPRVAPVHRFDTAHMVAAYLALYQRLLAHS